MAITQTFTKTDLGLDERELETFDEFGYTDRTAVISYYRDSNADGSVFYTGFKTEILLGSTVNHTFYFGNSTVDKKINSGAVVQQWMNPRINPTPLTTAAVVSLFAADIRDDYSGP